MMASCAGGGSAGSPVPLDAAKIEQMASDVHKFVLKDHLVRCKFLLKKLSKEEKAQIVNRKFDGKAALFVTAQLGHVHFLNYLIEECGADIEQRGVYEVQEDRSKHQVTPLWCAAVANKLEVVKELVKHGAVINATSDTESTPVRSACFMTNIEVVKFLLEHGADIHKPNINGGTCLINSVQSVELCRLLIEKGASLNAQDNSGNLALHYAIREGRMPTVKLLLRHGSDPYCKNDFGDDAIHTASIRGYSDILEYLIIKIKPPLHRQIEAYELKGTNFVDEKHDIQLALQTWRHAMELYNKETDEPIKRPPPLEPKAAYQHLTEARTLQELNQLEGNPDAVYMQSLLIRERILGPDHKDTIFGLMYRGAVYADTHHYQRCVDLWKYAFQLRHQKQEPLNHECLFTLQALCKLFWEIYEENDAGFTNEAVQYDDVIQVLKMATREVEAAKQVMKTLPLQVHQEEEFHTLLLLLIHLIHLLTKMETSDEQKNEIRHLVHTIIRMNTRGTNGKTLLHLVVDKKSSSIADEFYSRLPDVKVVDILIECGARVNGLDSSHDTPLHTCAENLREPASEVDSTEMQAIVKSLLEHGAHVDARNKDGVIAGQEVVNSNTYKLCLIEHTTLKCLAARTIQDHRLAYKGEVPKSLIPFIQLH